MEQQDNVLFDYLLIGAMVGLCLAPFILIFALLTKGNKPMTEQAKTYKIQTTIEHECGSKGWLQCDELTFTKIKPYLLSQNVSFIVLESEKVIDIK